MALILVSQHAWASGAFWRDTCPCVQPAEVHFPAYEDDELLQVPCLLSAVPAWVHFCTWACQGVGHQRPNAHHTSCGVAQPIPDRRRRWTPWQRLYLPGATHSSARRGGSRLGAPATQRWAAAQILRREGPPPEPAVDADAGALEAAYLHFLRLAVMPHTRASRCLEDLQVCRAAPNPCTLNPAPQTPGCLPAC